MSVSFPPAKRELFPEDTSKLSHMEVSKPLPKPDPVAFLTSDMKTILSTSNNFQLPEDGPTCPGAPRKPKPVIIGTKLRMSPRDYSRFLDQSKKAREATQKKPENKAHERSRIRKKLKVRRRTPRITNPFKIDSIRGRATLSRLMSKLSGSEKKTTNFKPQNDHALMIFKKALRLTEKHNL